MARRQAPVGAPRVAEGVADQRRRLVDLRDRLEGAIEDAAHRDLAPLAARYQAVLADLAALPEVTSGDGIDDLASRRASRRTAATGS